MAEEDWEQRTLAKRPWRRSPTPFGDIISQKYRGSGTAEDPYIVDWLTNDGENPFGWSSVYRWSITLTVAFATLAVSLASSAYSGAAESIERDFHVGSYVFILGITLFVLMFAAGPLFWAPASEVFGRRPCFVISYILFTVWNAVGAAAQNIESLLVFRLLAGFFGSYALVGSGGTISDMFQAEQRGLAMAIFSAAPFLGPALGPICGGFISLTSGWRWVQGFLGFFSGAVLILGFFIIPETYAPVLLRERAEQLERIQGGVYRAPMDAKSGPPQLSALFKTSLKRPWVLLFREPIVLLISLFMAIVYGCLYLSFAAFPIVFQRGRGWNAGLGGLAFLGILVGMMIAVAYVIFWVNPHYIKVSRKHGGRAPPEARLPPGIVGSFLTVIGLGWFAGVCGPNIPWIVPIIASVPFGGGIVLVFLSLMNYLVDSYLLYAASVLAANSALRSIFGAVFPLFTDPMFNKLGVNWGASIPAFLALACLPFPILFYKYGASIRKRCKFAAEAAAMLERMQQAQAAQNNNADEPKAPASAEEEMDAAEKGEGSHVGPERRSSNTGSETTTLEGDSPASASKK